MGQQENSLQKVCNGKIQQCIFTVMFCLHEVRNRIVWFAVIFTTNITLFLLASSSFPTPLCPHVQFSLVKRSFWTSLLFLLVSQLPCWLRFQRGVAVLFSLMQQKPPINTSEFISAFTNLSDLYKDVRTVVDAFGNKQKKGRKLSSDKQPGFHRIPGLSYALWTSKFLSTFCCSCSFLINSLSEQLEFDQYKICDFSNCD